MAASSKDTKPKGLTLRQVTQLKSTVVSTLGDYLEVESLSGHQVRVSGLLEAEDALSTLPEDNPFRAYFRHVIDELIRTGRVFATPLSDLEEAVRDAITDAVADHDLLELK